MGAGGSAGIASGKKDGTGTAAQPGSLGKAVSQDEDGKKTP